MCYFWLHWVFVTAGDFSSRGEWGPLFSFGLGGVSVQWLLWLGAQASVRGLRESWLPGSGAQAQ